MKCGVTEMESTQLRMFFRALAHESPTLQMLRDDPSQLKRRFGLSDADTATLEE